MSSCLQRLALVLTLLLAGCGRLGVIADSRTPVTFSFWGSYKDLELWKQLAEDFEQKRPDVRIVLQYTPNDYGEKLQLQLISNSAADIILMDDEPYPSYAIRGYLEDLQPYIERDREELRLDDFFPTAMDAFTFRGLTAAMPWDGMAVMMYYNKDLFDAAGIPYPNADWTWEDFREIARKLTVDHDGDGRPDQYGALFIFSWLDIQPLLWSFGARMLDEEGVRAAIDSPEAYAAARFMQAIKFEDRSAIWFGDQQGMYPGVQILTGRLGMTPVGWFMSQVLSDIKGGMRWGVCRMPRGPGGRYTRVTWDGISINAARPQPIKEIAWDFVKHLLSEESQKTIAYSGRGIPVIRDYALKYIENPETEVDEMQVIAAMEEDARLTPVTAKFLALRRAIDEQWRMLEREDPATRRTPEEVIPEVARRVNEVMASELEAFGENRGATVSKNPLPYQIAGAAALLMIAMLLVRLGRKTTSLHDLRVVFTSQKRRREALWGILFASPWMCGFCLFLAFPIVFSMVLSFSQWDPYDPVAQRVFIGLDNYVRAFTQDPLVWVALSRTFTYAFVAVPVTLCCALGLAMLLNQGVRGIRVFRTIFYIPNVVGGVATAIMWLYIFNPVFGPLNGGLARLNRLLDMTPLAFINLPEPQWLTDPNWAMPSLFIMMLWSTGGGAMIIFLAGLQGVPHHLYEAAELDGAGRWRKFWNVTLPMLSPTIFFNLIMGMIGALQVFMQAFVLLGREGGESNQLLFFVLYLYRKAFFDYEFGYAAALAWILFAIILTFTLLVIRSSALWVYYEGEQR